MSKNDKEEIKELKSCLKIVEGQLRESDRKNANLNRELSDYQEYFRLQKKLLKNVQK